MSKKNSNYKGNHAKDANSKASQRISKSQRDKNNKPRKDDPNQVQAPSNDAMNDIAWYAANPQLLSDTASIPFAWSTGLNLEPTRGAAYLPSTIPGICTMTVDPCPMSIGGASDPINIAARQMVADIRSKNSGGKAYDPSDFMITLLAQGELIAFLVHATRVYATASMYNPYNRYLPDSIFDTMQIDGQNIRDNLANYRAALNMRLAKAASVVYVPDSLNLFHRWRWLYANYYSDSENPKDQIYFLQPKGYRVYDIDETTSMGYLKWIPWNTLSRESPEVVGSLHTWEDIINAIDAMLDPLVEDQDLALIKGDMMKVYGANVMDFSAVPDFLLAQPVHNHDVLEQFRNAMTTPECANDASPSFYNDIRQDANGILLEAPALTAFPAEAMFPIGSSSMYLDYEYVTNLLNAYSAEMLMDSSDLNPTPITTMENTRLACRLDSSVTDPNTGETFMYFTNGSERVVDIIFAQRVKSGRTSYETKLYCVKSQVYIYSANPGTLDNRTNYLHMFNQSKGLQFIAMTKMFDYCPKLNITLVGHDGDYLRWTPLGITTRINNYALIPKEMLKKMNDCALLSEVGVIG